MHTMPLILLATSCFMDYINLSESDSLIAEWYNLSAKLRKMGM